MIVVHRQRHFAWPDGVATRRAIGGKAIAISTAQAVVVNRSIAARVAGLGWQTAESGRATQADVARVVLVVGEAAQGIAGCHRTIPVVALGGVRGHRECARGRGVDETVAGLGGRGVTAVCRPVVAEVGDKPPLVGSTDRGGGVDQPAPASGSEATCAIAVSPTGRQDDGCSRCRGGDIPVLGDVARGRRRHGTPGVDRTQIQVAAGGAQVERTDLQGGKTKIAGCLCDCHIARTIEVAAGLLVALGYRKVTATLQGPTRLREADDGGSTVECRVSTREGEESVYVKSDPAASGNVPRQ